MRHLQVEKSADLCAKALRCDLENDEGKSFGLVFRRAGTVHNASVGVRTLRQTCMQLPNLCDARILSFVNAEICTNPNPPKGCKFASHMGCIQYILAGYSVMRITYFHQSRGGNRVQDSWAIYWGCHKARTGCAWAIGDKSSPNWCDRPSQIWLSEPAGRYGPDQGGQFSTLGQSQR